MTVYKEFKVGGGKNPLGSFGGIIILTLFFIALYFIAKGLFTVLSWIAPVLLILTLIIDYRVVLDYGKFVYKILKNNILIGILAILLTILGFPIVTGFLFVRALLRYKLKGAIREHEKEQSFVEYEEVAGEEDFLELPPMEKTEKPPRAADSDYDNLFK